MTLILELTPEQERRLQAEAAKLGLDTVTYAVRRLVGDVPTVSGVPSVSEERAQQIAAAKEGFGKFAHIEGVSSDKFITAKQDEKARDERHWHSSFRS